MSWPSTVIYEQSWTEQVHDRKPHHLPVRVSQSHLHSQQCAKSSRYTQI